MTILAFKTSALFVQVCLISVLFYLPCATQFSRAVLLTIKASVYLFMRKQIIGDLGNDCEVRS